MMRATAFLGALLVSGCVSVELPKHLVSDTVQAGKDAYRSVAGDKDAPAGAKAPPAAAPATPPAPATPASPPPAPRRAIAHSYVGQDSQSVAELKQACVAEAAEKLRRLAGPAAPFIVLESSIATVGDAVVANCRVALEE